MKVRELIEKLQEFDPEWPVEFVYTYYEGCCSSNSWENKEERDVGEVYEATQRVSRKVEGPRGGKPAWRTVEEPVVRLAE